mgnify:CR=1 FL=1
MRALEDNIIMKDGKPFRVTSYEVDFGPKNGVAHVTVYDPCITPEAQQKRREAIVHKCQELIARGLM